MWLFFPACLVRLLAVIADLRPQAFGTTSATCRPLFSPSQCRSGSRPARSPVMALSLIGATIFRPTEFPARTRA